VNPAFITDSDNPCGVAVSQKYIYWAGDTGSYIGRANLNGTGANPNWLDVGTGVCWVSTNHNHLYWGNYSTMRIGRANIDGTGMNANFIPTTGGGARHQ